MKLWQTWIRPDPPHPRPSPPGGRGSEERSTQTSCPKWESASEAQGRVNQPGVAQLHEEQALVQREVVGVGGPPIVGVADVQRRLRIELVGEQEPRQQQIAVD